MADFRKDAGRLLGMLDAEKAEKALDALAGYKTLVGVSGMFTARLARDQAQARARMPTQAPSRPPAPPNTPPPANHPQPTPEPVTVNPAAPAGHPTGGTPDLSGILA